MLWDANPVFLWDNLVVGRTSLPNRSLSLSFVRTCSGHALQPSSRGLRAGRGCTGINSFFPLPLGTDLLCAGHLANVRGFYRMRGEPHHGFACWLTTSPRFDDFSGYRVSSVALVSPALRQPRTLRVQQGLAESLIRVRQGGAVSGGDARRWAPVACIITVSSTARGECLLGRSQ